MTSPMDALQYDRNLLDRGRLLSWWHAGSDPTALPAMLAWASWRGIPFHAAMTELATEASPWQRRRIRRAAIALENGAALSDVLDGSLSGMTPVFYAAAVRQSERDGCLPEMLPQLAGNIRCLTDMKHELRQRLMAPFIQCINPLMVILGLYVFILPKLEEIARDLIPDPSLPRLFEIVMTLSRFLRGPAGVLMFLLAFGFPMIWLVRKLTRRIVPSAIRRIPSWGIGLLASVPWLGRPLRKVALLETVGAMATLVNAGYDIAPAARWNAAAVSWPMLRRHLTAFAERVERGEPWALAWQKTGFGPSSHDWLLHNAAAREVPGQGFHALGNWLAQDIWHAHRLMLEGISVAGILLEAVVIGVSVLAVWQVLFYVLRQTLDMSG